MLPMKSPRPDTIANRDDGNQCVASFNVTTQPTAVAPPTSARPAEAMKKFEVDPKMNVPDAATIEPTINSRRAPHESTRTPVGICIATYV